MQLAAADLEAGRLAEAEKNLNKAKLAFFRSPNEQLDHTWLQVRLPAQQGRMDEAAATGRRAR
jgi:hypothetical protein